MLSLIHKRLTSLVLFLTIIIFISNTGMSQTLLSSEEFLNSYIKLNKTNTNIETFTIIDTLSLDIKMIDGSTIHSNLLNAYNEYKLAPQEINELLLRYSSVINYDNKPKTNIRDNILPVIKSKSYIDDLADKKTSFITKKINEELYVIYFIDDSLSYASLTEKQFISLNISKDSLHAIAISNLLNLNLEIQIYPQGDFWMLVAGGNFEASLILLDYIWTEENFPFEGEILILVLSRDLVLITDSKSSKGIKSIEQLIINNNSSNTSYYISNKFYIYNDKNWEIYNK